MPEQKCSKCGNSLIGNNCSMCGLPQDLCACAGIDLESQKIRVTVTRRKFDKPVTIVEGVTDRRKEVASQLKARLACGGTVKDNHIELMGDHRLRLKGILVKLGYSSDQIEVS